MRVEKSDHGFWVEYRDGRKRFIPFGTATANRIAQGLTIEKIERRRTEKTGHIEPVTYYRDAEGNIGIPPEPNLLPEGAIPLQATSLQELDKLSREMTDQMRATWRDEGFTEEMEQMLGMPRKELVAQMQESTPYGQEVIRGLLSHLDKEESDRDRVSANVYFRHREYDN